MKSFLQIIFLGLLAVIFYQCEYAHGNPSAPAHPPKYISPEEKVPLVVDIFLEPPSLPPYRVINTEKSIEDKFDDLIRGGSSYPHAKAINRVARLEDAFVRRVRTKIDPRHSGALNLGLVFDLYDYADENKIYINDPLGKAYFSTVLEYWVHHTGDNTDAAICLAVALGAVGCHSRVVFAQGETGEHVYVELYVGVQEEELRKYVDYIHARYPEADQQDISFYTDKRGDIWLNLQIANPYPGYLSFDGIPQHLFYPLLRHWYDF